MGTGMAQVAAQSGFATILFDLDANVLDDAKKSIRQSLHDLARKKQLSEEQKEQIFNRIKFTSEIKDCTAFVIIETIVEIEKAKISLFTELANYNNEEVIFATSTSSLSISAIQEKIPFPQRVIGIHFFNTPYTRNLAEVVKGRQTNKEVVSAVLDICKKMGKTPVLCEDSPGFIVNRIGQSYYLESLKIVEEKVTSFEEVDEILEATGFKIGPFKLMDLIGLDINLTLTESIYHSFNNRLRFAPFPLQREKVQKNLLGQKTGEGFYKYQ